MVPARDRDPRRPRHAHGTEAITELVRYLFEYRTKHKVCADCDIRNEPSWKLLERVGFRREGEMHEAFWDGDGWASEYLYGMLASDWHARATLGRTP